MKKIFLIVFSSLLLVSCATSLIKTGVISDQNRIHMAFLRVGMNQDQVLDIMGNPFKIEVRECDRRIYQIWFYITEPTILGQTQLINRNFSPLVFELGILKGWGRNFYKFTFNIDNARWKKELEKKQAYTNDLEEWPRNQHLEIPPMNAQKEKSFEEQRQENINREIIEVENPQENQIETGEIQPLPTQESQPQQQTISTIPLPSNSKEMQNQSNNKKTNSATPLKKSNAKKQNNKHERKSSKKPIDKSCGLPEEDENYFIWE